MFRKFFLKMLRLDEILIFELGFIHADIVQGKDEVLERSYLT